MTSLEKPSIEAAVIALDPTSSPSLEQYYRERLENVRQHLPDAANQLRSAGVARVHIGYDGCGDEGQIDSVSYVDAENNSLDPTGKISLTEEALADLFYDLIQARHPGWENNGGAFGEIDWDLIADTVYHSHTDRFIDYSTTEHEGL